MEIVIMSEWEAERWSFSVIGKESVVISITEPEPLHVPEFASNREIKGVLRLEFQDVQKMVDGYDLVLMSASHGVEIKEFIDRYKEDVSLIVVHCHAGISRSPSVAGAIAIYLGLSDDFVWDGRYIPNRYCFELLNKVLCNDLTDEDIDIRYLCLDERLKQKEQSMFRRVERKNGFSEFEIIL